MEGHQQAIDEGTRLIEAQRSKIEKKTAELNDGTGLTSRDMVNLQEEIAGHEARNSELEESQLDGWRSSKPRKASLPQSMTESQKSRPPAKRCRPQ